VVPPGVVAVVAPSYPHPFLHSSEVEVEVVAVVVVAPYFLHPYLLHPFHQCLLRPLVAGVGVGAAVEPYLLHLLRPLVEAAAVEAAAVEAAAVAAAAVEAAALPVVAGVVEVAEVPSAAAAAVAPSVALRSNPKSEC